MAQGRFRGATTHSGGDAQARPGHSPRAGRGPGQRRRRAKTGPDRHLSAAKRRGNGAPSVVPDGLRKAARIGTKKSGRSAGGLARRQVVETTDRQGGTGARGGTILS